MSDLEVDGETGQDCPMCGSAVRYGGRGRRPVYCSTRCKNRAANVRAAVRDGAPVVEVRRVELPASRRPSGTTAASATTRNEAALRRVSSSPVLTLRLLHGLEEAMRGTRRRDPEWTGVWVGLDHLMESLLYHRRAQKDELPSGAAGDAPIEPDPDEWPDWEA